MLIYTNKASAVKVLNLENGTQIHQFENEDRRNLKLFIRRDIPVRVLLTSDNKFAIVLFTDSIGVFSLEEKKQIHKIQGTGIIR